MGQGVSGRVDGQEILLGNRQLLEERQIGVEGVDSEVTRLAGQGKTVLFLAIDGRFAALLAIADKLKPEVPAAVAVMRKMGLRLIMLTGDQEITARAIAAQAGIDEVIAQVMPDRKAEQQIARSAPGAPRTPTGIDEATPRQH